MNCEESREVMIAVLYGEEPDPLLCFEFFRHLEGCEECNREYLELIQTREMLQKWEVSPARVPTPSCGERASWKLRRWWPGLQKVAAGFLILVGAISILQYMGLLGGPHVTVSEEQLNVMLHDMIVVYQTQEREVIGRAFVRLKEDVDLERRDDMLRVYEYLVTLEERYTENLEENNRYLRTLLTQ